MKGRGENAATLGEKLNTKNRRVPVGVLVLIPFIAGGVVLWFFKIPDLAIGAVFLGMLYSVLVVSTSQEVPHFLTYGDRQGFMKNLVLCEKAAIFDGSNIYHFGLDHGVGKKALRALILGLRSDGFRVVCFFDANIYYTLIKGGDYKNGSERFSISILERIFDLRADEIYVVPSGIQADKFIVETLSHLPISFAVTNDRFRDFEANYDFLTKDNSWRKGVKLQAGNLLLYQYNFQHPLAM